MWAANRLESRKRLALFLGFLNLLWVCLLLLDLPGVRRLHGFSGLDTGGTHQLSRKIRVLGSQGIVHAFVQLDAIATCCREALTGNGIKACGMLIKGSPERA